MLDKIRYFLKRHYEAQAVDSLSLNDNNTRQIERSVSADDSLILVDKTWWYGLVGGPIILEAPYPGIETTTFLPLPSFMDTENLLSIVEIEASMAGELYSYIRESDKRQWTFRFELSRAKALELYEFLEAYSGVEIRIRGWKGKIIHATILSNPIPFTYISRMHPTGLVDIPIEFEGVELLNA